MDVADNPPALLTLYAEEQCVFWECRRFPREGSNYCSEYHEQRAVAESQYNVAHSFGSIYSFVQFEAFILPKVNAMMRRNPPINTGVADLTANDQVLSTYPWEAQDIFNIGNMNNREDNKLWMFIGSFVPDRHYWIGGHVVRRNKVRKLFTPKTFLPIGRRFKLYRYTMINTPNRALYALWFHKPDHGVVLNELELEENAEDEAGGGPGRGGAGAGRGGGAGGGRGGRRAGGGRGGRGAGGGRGGRGAGGGRGEAGAGNNEGPVEHEQLQNIHPPILVNIVQAPLQKRPMFVCKLDLLQSVYDINRMQSDSFLKDNSDWLSRAIFIDWAKFRATGRLELGSTAHTGGSATCNGTKMLSYVPHEKKLRSNWSLMFLSVSDLEGHLEQLLGKSQCFAWSVEKITADSSSKYLVTRKLPGTELCRKMKGLNRKKLSITVEPCTSSIASLRLWCPVNEPATTEGAEAVEC